MVFSDKKQHHSLADLYPDIAKQWNYKENNLPPTKIAPHSNKKFSWICDKGHIYTATVDKRVSGVGCPYCSNKKVLTGYNDLKSRYPKIAEEWNYELNNGRPEDYVFGSTYRANWICSECNHQWASKILSRTKRSSGCPKCALIKRAQNKHLTSLKTTGCITDTVLIEEWDSDKNKPYSEYTKNSNHSVWWVCSKCGYNYKSKISNRTILHRGCPLCANQIVLAGKNDLSTTHPQLALEWNHEKNGSTTPEKVTYGSGKKVWWKCPIGHEYQATILHRVHGTNCPICNSGRQTSFAEQAIFFYIKKIYPDAINRFTAPFLKKMELDIFIPSINLAIEYDGEAWHKDNSQTKEQEKYKRCQSNQIKLIRIREKIPENSHLIADACINLEGKMWEHKQLEKVIIELIRSLDPCSNFWTRKNPRNIYSPISVNIERDRYEIQKNIILPTNNSLLYLHPNIAKEWHPVLNKNLSPSQVKPHSDLKVWWLCPTCKNQYLSSVSHRISGTGCPKCGIQKSAQKRSKPVKKIDIHTGEVLEIFPSASEASRKTKISCGNIIAVCKKIRKQAGGYIWEYSNLQNQ